MYNLVAKETDECSICLISYKSSDILSKIKSCNHLYHQSCLLEWKKRSNTCPLCRIDVVENIEVKKTWCFFSFLKKLIKL